MAADLPPSRMPAARAVGLVGALCAALYVFVRQLHPHYPIQAWLFWRYAGYWLACLLWSAACASFGHRVLMTLFGRPLPIREHWVTAFAIGVYGFFLGMFAGGVLGLYGRAFFYALPAAMLAAGAGPASRYFRRLARHWRARRRTAPPASPWLWPVFALGLLGLLLVYVAVIVPENAAYDTRWQHLAIAEHYAAEGAVRRLPEGWYIGTQPHLASYLYTWAFLRPGATLFDRIELAAHLELAVFIATVAGISAVVRCLLRGRRVELAWVGRFLFPAVFLYDGSLGIAADHVAALFAVPIATLSFRAWRRLDWRFSALLGMAAAGAVLTKYTAAAILLGFPVVVVVVRSAIFAVRAALAGFGRGTAPPRGWWLGTVAAAASGLVLTAPHWLKNLIWYGDPLYPVLHRWFTPRPWTPDSADRYEHAFVAQLWRPTKNWAGLKESLKVLGTFSFVPNDWPRFHGAVPVFGSLFTLTIACLPWLKGTRRTWALVAGTHLGVFAWYWMHHQDRYLEAVVPWMAATTVAVLVLAWRAHRVARPFLGALCALQVVWGADVFFMPGHAMLQSPLKAAADLISSGYRKDFAGRERVMGGYTDVAAALPKGAKVLVHDHHTHLGIGAASVNDAVSTQGGISYAHLATPRAVYERLASYGVTHLLWVTGTSSAGDSVAGDLVFFDFVLRYGREPRPVAGFTLARMPAEPPPDEPPAEVAVFGCGAGSFFTGIYRLDQTNVPLFGPRRNDFPVPLRPAEYARVVKLEPWIGDARYLVVDTKCHDTPGTDLASAYTLAARRRWGTDLWVRR
jgi:hypothetical protein